MNRVPPSRVAPRSRPVAVLGALAALLLLTACGGTVADPGAGPGPGAPAAITVDTARGPVGLPGPAVRVVSLEWAYTEELTSLGVTPVGAADVAGYGTWITAPGTQLPPGVADVGTKNSPSLEQITALAPDLIVAADDRVGANYEALARIAPVLSLDYTAAPQIETMKSNFRGLAAAVGRTDRADEVLAQLDTRTADLRGRLAAAGRTGAGFAVGQGFTSQGAPSIRMLGDRAIVAQILSGAGLRNAWSGQPDSYGMTTVGVEGLSRVPPTATFLYVATPADDPFAGTLAANPLYRNLPFVAEGRTRALDPGTWFFGGPASAMLLLDEAGRAFRV